MADFTFKIKAKARNLAHIRQQSQRVRTNKINNKEIRKDIEQYKPDNEESDKIINSLRIIKNRSAF
jgi:hypothetical protein